MNAAVDADDGNPQLRRLTQEALQDWKSRLIQILKSGIERGEVVSDSDPLRVANTFIAVLEGSLLISRIEGSSRAREDARCILNTLLAGLHPTGQERARLRLYLTAYGGTPPLGKEIHRLRLSKLPMEACSFSIEIINVYNPPMNPKPPSPMLVFETLQAHQQTSALRAGIELKLFTAIAGGARTPEALAPICGASAKGLRILCDFLTITGFLTKDASGYALTPDSELFLVESSPAYMGGMASFLFHPFIEKGLGSMTEAVRKGGTVLPAEGSVSDDNPVWVDFARGMAPLTAPSAGLMAELIAGTGPLQVLDIAAGHGMFGLTIAKHNPAAEIHALDWKNVLAVAHENAVKLGVADRWHPIEGSAFAADYGSGYDAVLVTNFIHHFDVPTNIGLFEKIRAAMKPGAKMAIVEMAVNDDRITPPGAGMFAMTMLTTTASGDAFSQREIESMCTRAGFHGVTHHAVPSTPQTLTIAVN